ncbi:unnamed protein product [Agarophyton chilense]
MRGSHYSGVMSYMHVQTTAVRDAVRYRHDPLAFDPFAIDPLRLMSGAHMGAIGQASQRAVWIFRALAIGSSVVAAAVITPQLQTSSCEQATQLARSSEPFFIREGMRRMYHALCKNRCSVERMVELGADHVVRDGLGSDDKGMRTWAMRLGGVLVAGGRVDVLRHEGFAEVLGADICDSNCVVFCEAAGLGDCSLPQRRRLLQEASAARDAR